MRNQKFIGILAIAIFALNLALPFAFAQEVVVAASDPAEWYMTVPGVLDSDTYVLYPYELKSLTIGFSKFGEMIDGNTKKGLEYNGVDPFASDPYVPEFEWSQGWVINITYAYGGWFRNVWAFALYSDQWGSSSIGGDWKRAPSPDSTSVVGGRKYGGWSADGTTIGYVESDPIKVLYDGPRRFVALSRTTIYEDTGKENPLVRVDLTFVFNKVKKYVIVFKDIKRLDKRKFSSQFQVEFSNRGEWDLGKVQSPKSYAHWFDGQLTCYHEGWHPYYGGEHPAWYDVAQVISSDTPGYVGFAAFWPSLISKYMEATTYISRSTILTTMETYIAKYSGTGSQTTFIIGAPHPQPIEYPRGDGVWSDEPMVFVNGKLQAPAGKLPTEWAVDYPYNWTSPDTVTFLVPPPSGTNNVWFVYKRSVHKTDMSVEPAVPYIIGEWDFDLPNAPAQQFRGVTVYGVVNHHDAVDDEVIDREVKYLLDEVFNPWDLVKAVHKETKRWVEFETKSDGTFTTTHRPVIKVDDEDWDQYCEFSERVIDLSEGYELEARAGYNWRGQDTYYVTYNDDGTMTISGLDIGHDYKILYSTKPEDFGGSGLEKQVWLNTTGWNTPCNSTIVEIPDIDEDWYDRLGVKYSFTMNFDNVTIHLIDNTSDWSASWSWTWNWAENEFKVPRKETYYSDIGNLMKPINITLIDESGKTLAEILGFDVDEVKKDVSNEIGLDVTWPIDGETVHILSLTHNVTVEFQLIYNHTTGWLNISRAVSWIGTHHSKLGGRYEWTIVGKDAATVDSVGAALVTAAFKNKQVEIGNAGEDMYDPMLANQIPWVMRKFGAGTAKTDYYYLDGTKRTALKDDWCKTWPVASSNMIGVGGPLANLLAYYGNDFTDAFYGISDFAHPDWKGKVIALPCWAKNTYSSNENKGYAVIATYKDLNGTVLFLIWGHWGRDTFYASKFFHEEIIYELQEKYEGIVDEANADILLGGYKFNHVTALILEIDYKDPEHPTFRIPEVLGTISEKAVGLKGGIHDP